MTITTKNTMTLNHKTKTTKQYQAYRDCIERAERESRDRIKYYAGKERVHREYMQQKQEYCEEEQVYYDCKEREHREYMQQ